jgi:tetratricopeptide (TPR) repeat protein
MVAALTIAVILAAATLGAQRPLTPAEAATQYDRANQYFAAARYEDAYKQYNKVFSGAEGDLVVNALKGMIRTALRLSSFQIARQEAEALKLRSDDADALTLYGDSLWGGGLFDEAERAYQAARDKFPDSPRARFGVARTLAARGRLDDALKEAQAALTGAPADPDILVLGAEVYERLFRYEDAIPLYAQYVSLLPRRVRSESEIAGTKIRLLQNFKGRQPMAMGDDKPHTVPFTVRDKKVVVAGKLNGVDVEFVLDTGADRTAVTGRTADRAGIRAVVETLITGVGAPGARKLSIGRADSISIGDVSIHDVPVSIRRENMPNTQPWQNEALSPASLGLSVVVDYKTHQLTFGRQVPVEAADFSMPLRVYRLPVVRGLVNAKYPASFVVDTGGEMLSISKDMATQLAMRPARHIGLQVWGVMGADRDAFVLPGVDLNFDRIEYQRFAVAVLNLRAPSVLLGFQLGGILGYTFLSEYNVAMDFARGELRLRKLS